MKEKSPLLFLVFFTQFWLLSSVEASVIYFQNNPVTSRDSGFNVTGSRFTVGASQLNVTKLGFYDLGANGLSSGHEVGIYRVSDQFLLGSASIATGTSATLDAGFRWTDLAAAISLAANTAYAVVATNGSDGPTYGSFSNAGFGALGVT